MNITSAGRSSTRGTVACALAVAFALPVHADVPITNASPSSPYVRWDGGTDATIADCSDLSTTPEADGDGSARRQQNEPTIAVNPSSPQLITAGANDYCPVQTTTDAWAGFYFSADGGAHWTKSLLPGYSTDTSTLGQASPLHGLVTSAGDPVQAWDNANHLYYGGIAFNRSRPASGSIWVARYSWSATAAPTYQFTTLVARGTPSPLFLGQFNDKIMLEVDRGVESPFSGNVYVCWARFTGGANNFVYLATSRDGGRTFKIQKVSEGTHGNQSCDIAVTRDGTVFVAWNQFEFLPPLDTPQKQHDAVAWVKSTDGGRSFTKPRVATEFVRWAMRDQTAAPLAAAAARFAACLAADAPLGACEEATEPQATARDCGDGPYACESGYVFGRAVTSVHITADPTADGDPNEAYVTYEATVPGSETPTGTTYGTVVSGVGSQGSVYFIKTTDGGGTWTSPMRIDPQPVGHQFYSDIDADSGRLHVVYHDSRASSGRGPPSTPSGGDFRTVPFGNQWMAANPPGGVSTGPALQTFHAVSSDDGATWAASLASSVPFVQNYEQFGNRDSPFFGDYNYIDAVGDKVAMAWTDSRDTVPGDDPRYPEDGTDGFDVHQCRELVADVWSSDRCPNAGGLDQNIYGLVLP